MRYMFFFYDVESIRRRRILDKKWFDAADEVEAHMSADEYAYEHDYGHYELKLIQEQ